MPNAQQDKVPEEYIRKQTLTNAERYITNELKEKEAIILNAVPTGRTRKTVVCRIGIDH